MFVARTSKQKYKKGGKPFGGNKEGKRKNEKNEKEGFIIFTMNCNPEMDRKEIPNSLVNKFLIPALKFIHGFTILI